ncbi:MAG: hypothetical protein DMF02_03860 [Verrucomicrobia bacterium]|nr:MAG: hypothetical protein DMF02_03860 [Verrucomicrobiota bacterium]
MPQSDFSTQPQRKEIMKKYLTFATVAVSIAAMPDKAAMEAKEKSAWQAFKDKNSDAFKKLVDKDIRCVYANRISTGLQNELADMKNWDMKSFEISDFEMFSDEKDVVVTTYKVKVEGTADGKDASGTYNAGSVWKLENGQWLAIFHTNIKEEAATTPAG